MSSTSFHKWLSLVGVIWLQSINGTNSNFPAYSSQFKNLLSLSQIQLNNLAFASDAGKLFGWFSGIATNYLPLWLVLMIGSTLGLIGYGIQYLFITKQIASPSYWYIFILCVLAGNSICWINTVCYVVTIRNFASNSQVAVGLSTSYQGLSAKIYTDIVDVFFSFPPFKRARGYLLLNSAIPIILCFMAAPLVRDIDVGNSSIQSRVMVMMFVITIVTGIYAVITSFGKISTGLSPLNNMIGLGVLLLLPLMVPFGEKFREMMKQRKLRENRERRVYDVTVGDEDGGGERMENGVKEERESGEIGGESATMEEIGVKLMVQRVEFWLYFFVYIFGATLGLVFLNNLGQIAESRGYNRTSSLVSLSSSFGFFGRLMPSLLDYFLSGSKYMISRPASMAILMAPMSGAFFLLLNSKTYSLYVSTAIIGVCTGAITSLSVSTTTELFGAKNFSVNHNVLIANIPIGSFIFGYSAALLYHKEGNGNGKCFGMQCYKTTFIIWGSLCLIGTLLALILYARTRKFYSQRR